jgi:hypothetical protein
LWDAIITLDVRRMIESVKSRSDALTFAKLTEGASDGENSKCKIEDLSATANELFVYVLDTPDTKRTWEFDKAESNDAKPGQCTTAGNALSSFRNGECMINGLSLRKDGTLIGYPRSATPTTIRAIVKDANEVVLSNCEFAVNVKPSNSSREARASFALRVLEAALSPQLLNDDQWFRSVDESAKMLLFAAPAQPALSTSMRAAILEQGH